MLDILLRPPEVLARGCGGRCLGLVRPGAPTSVHRGPPRARVRARRLRHASRRPTAPAWGHHCHAGAGPVPLAAWRPSAPRYPASSPKPVQHWPHPGAAPPFRHRNARATVAPWCLASRPGHASEQARAGYRARRRWPTAQREGGGDSELASQGGYKEHKKTTEHRTNRALAPSTVRPLARDPRVLIGWPFPLGFGLDGRLLLAVYWHGVGGFMFNSSSSSEQTAPAHHCRPQRLHPTPAAVTAPKGPWANHHRNWHRCRFRRRQHDSAGLLLCVVHQRLLVARGCFARRLFRAVSQRSNPRRRAVIILIVTVGGKRAAASCHFHHRTPRLRRRRPWSRPTRRAKRAAAGAGRRRRRRRRPTAAQTPALPLPTRRIRTVALSDCRLQRNGWMVFTGRSSRFR